MLALCSVDFFYESHFPLWKIHKGWSPWKHKVECQRMRQNRKKRSGCKKKTEKIELFIVQLSQISAPNNIETQCAFCQCAHCYMLYRNICLWYNKASKVLLENWTLFGWGRVYLVQNRKSWPENLWAVWTFSSWSGWSSRELLRFSWLHIIIIFGTLDRGLSFHNASVIVLVTNCSPTLCIHVETWNLKQPPWG